MRRWLLGGLAILTAGAVVALAALSTPARVTRLTAALVGNLARIEMNFEGASLARAGRLVRVARVPLGVIAGRAIDRAWADEMLQFHPVSAESAARIEDRSRRARATVTPPPPAAARASAAHGSAAAPPATAPASAADSLKPLPPEAPAVPAEPAPPRHSGEMMRIGSDIHVERDQTIEGDVVAISGDVRVDGHVKGSVQALGGDVYLSSNARVDGDVAAVRGELHEESGAYVGGQRVTALGGSSVRIGRNHLHPMLDEMGRPVRQAHRAVKELVHLLVMLGLVWLALRITPHRTAVAVDVLRRETAASLGVGLLTWVLVVPSLVALALVVAILCITIIGIPVALAALMAYSVLLVVLFFWGFIVGAAWLGGQLMGRSNSSLLRLALTGTAIIIGLRAVGHLIGMVPFFGFLGGLFVVVGWALSGTAITLGAGALLRSESASGALGRWWRNWRGDPTRAVGPAPGPSATPRTENAPVTAITIDPSASTTDPAPPTAGPAPPSDPSSFAPPPSTG
ncbi:MAG: polymer-forming cytoskeletal protein [Candidatus Eisenbacteria bacterium]|nr:polymer-forming cytoskeletal protein [Candidatus Eisenbacteria bacterium]